MAKIVLDNAKQLLTCAGTAPKRGAYLRDLGLQMNASVVIEGNNIAEIGPAANIRAKYQERIDRGEYSHIDMSGKVVLPGLIDPHTHALFVGTREDEFEMRIEGKAYVDILVGGGGILNTVNRVRKASKEELVEETLPRLQRMLAHGTTTVEIKSGYGLDTETEIKMLDAIESLGEQQPLDIVPTFMGAHAIPPEFNRNVDGYTDYIVHEMLPAIAKLKTTEFCDIFCEHKVFPLPQTRRILQTAKNLGLRVKIHADEIEAIGGSDLAIDLEAVSAEHLLQTSDATIGKFATSSTIAVLLPGTAFSLMHGTYARAREMVDRGVAVALATDCNPGSCYTESMQMVLAIACTQMGLLSSEAINAATINAACALGRQDRVGSIEVGKQADIIAMSIPDYKYIPYHFGVNHVDFVLKRGNIVVGQPANSKSA